MSIPDFQTIMRPILESVHDGVAIPLSALREHIADVYQLSEIERKDRLPSGRQTVMNNRVGWARTYLNKAGLLIIPSKGMVQITARGREALANGPERLTVTWLKQFPEFADFHTAKPQMVDVLEGLEAEVPKITPDEQLAEAHQALLQSLADEILTQVRAATPVFFEQLVVDLMLAMGYGGSRREAGRATQATNENNLGVSVKQVYEVKQMDSDYFGEE